MLETVEGAVGAATGAATATGAGVGAGVEAGACVATSAFVASAGALEPA